MKEISHNTEEIILAAAKKIFIEYGYDGARMQQIADEAGINKALLHYYFRSKDNLFDYIFDKSFKDFFPDISIIMMSDMPVEKKIRMFASHYIDTLLKNPHLPVFVFHELQRKPERVVSHIKSSGINLVRIKEMMTKELKEKGMTPIPIEHLVVSMIGMCVFPFIGRPILESFIFNSDTKAYDKFLEERKKFVADFIISALKKK